MFQSNGCSDDEVISTVLSKISAAQNQFLLRPFSGTEVLEAVKSMHPDKSPGPDGMNPGFYQGFWHEVGPRVTEACLECLNQRVIPQNLNDTTIVLIPKVQKPTRITELRPISLCNVIVKIMTKMVANRLKTVLDTVISENQSAFIPGRLITNNVLVAFEVGHYLRRKRKGITGFASLKIDMSKAYDRVEWKFVEHMLLKLGFAVDWVKLIMLFVTTVRYSIIHGGNEIGPITPARGLRQGDPATLSVVVFNLCGRSLLYS